MKKQQHAPELDKPGAAQYLNVSERAIERYQRSGLLHPRTIKSKGTDGRTRPANMYAVAELDQVKALMQVNAAPLVPAPTGQPGAAAAAGGQALAVRSGAAVDLLRVLLDHLQPGAAAPAVAVADKLSLSVAEAAALAGYSRGFIRGAIAAGKLKAAKGRTRGWNILRRDLDQFVAKL